MPLLFVLPVVAVAMSGCVGTDYNYVTHSNPDKTSLYFKIPAQWKNFNYGQIIESANGKLSNTQLSQIQGAQWILAFSGSPKFTAKGAAAYGSKYPTGAAFSEQISQNDQDSFSLSTLRSYILGSDPEASGSQDTVLNYSLFTTSDGQRGSRMTVDIPQSNGKIITYGQVAMVNSATSQTYAMGIGCYASCWGPNEGLINQILKSWTVKER